MTFNNYFLLTGDDKSCTCCCDMKVLHSVNGSPLEAFDPQRVGAIRRRTKLSQKAFGEKLGFTGQYIGLIEAGKCRPSMVFLDKLSAVFGVRTSSLFRRVS